MITITVVTSTRWTSRTRNSSSSPNNTDVASDMLVASLLDVVEDQQHVGATSPHRLRHEPQCTPLKFEEPDNQGPGRERAAIANRDRRQQSSSGWWWRSILSKGWRTSRQARQSLDQPASSRRRSNVRSINLRHGD